jgi:acyl-CoA synthetase (AMP-forming)/AMP-acid ligase II
MHTPYGATEALPVASIESRTVLEETSALTSSGAGTCVGQRFSGIRWKVIRITDDPIQTIDQSIPVADGEIGELMVSGDVISKTYMTRTDQNAMHKVDDCGTVWHRMGDVGYLDEQDRFWFCGRKSQRVTTKHGTLHTETIEAVANTHPAVYRSALVGVGPAKSETATLILEPWSRASKRHRLSKQQILQQVRALLDSNQRAKNVERIVIYPKKLPTDIRHNSKIFREKLAEWANKTLEL